MVSMTPLDPLNLMHKLSCWIQRSHQDHGIRSCTAGSLNPNPNFANDYLECLGKSEVICETAVARESGVRALGGIV
jgi:hypothetical protein